MPPNPVSEPRRARFDDRRRLTIPKPLRDALPWLQAVKANSDAAYELVTPGRARLLVDDPIAAALAEENHAAAIQLSAGIIYGTWETTTRITLPPLVSDWLFGIGKTPPPDVLLWANESAIEFWSDEEWPRAQERLRRTNARYLLAD